MNAVVIEHVKVAELPEAWRNKLAIPADARVTVRIEDEAAQPTPTEQTSDQSSIDPAFGIWRDREDMADVEGYVRKLRASRYNRDGSRKDG
ncbi:MAG: hypothetical protein EPO31_05190 [Gammaproteobacteria bacterium]|nr:MAG: hypothetical protein EPO31_05190 [Gammaproteobacteria bacterium]